MFAPLPLQHLYVSIDLKPIIVNGCIFFLIQWDALSISIRETTNTHYVVRFKKKTTSKGVGFSTFYPTTVNGDKQNTWLQVTISPYKKTVESFYPGPNNIKAAHFLFGARYIG